MENPQELMEELDGWLLRVANAGGRVLVAWDRADHRELGHRMEELRHAIDSFHPGESPAP